ncbi:penicillin-binding protein 2 [Aestuariirhabdus litorea]|uniref:Peptidoglycan D,D-transpeptidase FtsI n=2 Tax=Aestuariirhabdus litorea TaxID=2528527 RepID=A0A3P3VVP4_9GAMM|nr:penicillin-binding protein 2 [Aestuariirhabdus litorea]RWW98737.1 penicillin-binding protein 2 [Endozoicomonadaceae bacterium GTF-13]
MWRIVDLQVVDRQFLQDEGDKRTVRYSRIAATRGIIFDRNGRALAVSTPVVSIWVNPQEVKADDLPWAELSKKLNLSERYLKARMLGNESREFVYLKRHLTPDQGKAVLDLDIDGIYSIDEYRRYYPSGEVAAHLVGFTDVDGNGQEGLELSYNDWLEGRPGKYRMLKDRRGRLVKSAELVASADPGKDLMLSIDMRVQYLAYRELKAAVSQHNADGGSMVVMDVESGEVLAMVNQPAYNPNNRKRINVASLRNRAMTDVFEPGSTVKPLTLAAAFETGRYGTGSKIDTTPGLFRVGPHLQVKDHRNYGVVDMTTLLAKSSNVATSKIALDIGAEPIWDLFYQLGLGQASGSGFPGESSGSLPSRGRWRPTETATLSYGYGISVTALQLASAYSVLARDGVKKPVTLLRDGNREARPEQVISPRVARDVRRMLSAVVEAGGTGTQAAVEGYSVSGKTGTVHKVSSAGYEEDQYMSTFAGMAPADQPRIVTVVMIDNPKSGDYYGGAVAAPVFSSVVAGTLHLLGETPADVKTITAKQRQGSVKRT